MHNAFVCITSSGSYPADQEVMPGVTIRPLSRRSQRPKFQCLNLDDGPTPVWYEGEALISLGGCLTPVCGESPSAVVDASLSSVLESSVHPKYCLSSRACAGILRRARARGKALPPMLQAALEARAAEQDQPTA